MRASLRLLLVPLWLALLVAWSPSAFSLTYPDTPESARAQYTQMRASLQARSVPAASLLAACDASLRGQVMEIPGRLMSSLRLVNADGLACHTFLLQTPDGVAVALRSSEPLQGIRLDEAIRVLASLPPGSTAAEFTLHGLIREGDLNDLQPPATPVAVAPAAAAPLPAGTAPPPPPPAATQIIPVVTQSTTPLPAGVPSPTRVAVWDGIPADTADTTPPRPDLPDVGMTADQIAMWKGFVAQRNTKLSDLQLELVVRWVIAYSAIYGVDHRLSFALIAAESNFNPLCVSHAGATGMTQLMPFNVKDMGVENTWNVQQNIRGGIRLFSLDLARYKDRPNYEQCILGLAAYNAGYGAVRKYGGVPPYKETQNYVRKVSAKFYELVQAGYP